jgi:ribosome-interacting GTPase 1
LHAIDVACPRRKHEKIQTEVQTTNIKVNKNQTKNSNQIKEMRTQTGIRLRARISGVTFACH